MTVSAPNLSEDAILDTVEETLRALVWQAVLESPAYEGIAPAWVPLWRDGDVVDLGGQDSVEYAVWRAEFGDWETPPSGVVRRVMAQNMAAAQDAAFAAWCG